jgi:uncharacterized membrane protein YfcA
MPFPELVIVFFMIALIYASVGFGGGSSYLAILALYAMPFREMRMIALICNIVVVTGGTIAFARHGMIRWRKIVPLIIFSVPCAYLGARMKISDDLFFLLLGCSLIVASFLLWIKYDRTSDFESRKTGFIENCIAGGSVGFLSGMVGIGGGIFLSPLLNLMRWDDSKHIAATASMFILVNSMAGVAGQLSVAPVLNVKMILILGTAVFAGGQIGSNIGIVRFNLNVVRRITALLVLVAGIEVLIKRL